MIPWFQFESFSLGPITIYVWGLFVALGFILSTFIFYKRGKRLGFNVEYLFNQLIWIAVFGIIFARLFHVFFYEPFFYYMHPFDIIKIWQGGMSSFGGLFGAAVIIWIYQKKEKLSWGRFIERIDLLSFSAVFGWIVGRLGCFMIHDHLGRGISSFLSIKTSEGPRIETALLEIVALIPLVLWFFIVRKKTKKAGWFTAILFIYYGAIRFISDFWRATDIPNADVRYFGLTPGQFFAILLLIGGILLLKHIHKKDKGKS